MALSYAMGLLLGVLSAVANGSFTVPSKVGPVKAAQPDPFIFNLYVCLSIGLSSLLVLLFGVNFHFTPLGLISGLLLCFSTVNSFRAVGILGVSVASGIWCGTAIVVAFLFGHFFDEPVQQLLLGLLALVILVASICGIAYAQQRAQKEESEPLLEEGQPQQQQGATRLIRNLLNTYPLK